jgi:hypothetical protein
LSTPLALDTAAGAVTVAPMAGRGQLCGWAAAAVRKYDNPVKIIAVMLQQERTVLLDET